MWFDVPVDETLLSWVIAGLALALLVLSLFRFNQQPGAGEGGTIELFGDAKRVAGVVGSILLLKKLEFYSAIALAFVLLLAHGAGSSLGVPTVDQFFRIAQVAIAGYLVLHIGLLIWRLSLKSATRRLREPDGEQASAVTVGADLPAFWQAQVKKFVEREAVV